MDLFGAAGVGGGGGDEAAGCAVAEADQGGGVVFGFHAMHGGRSDLGGVDALDANEPAE